jgi:HEAT repeat protein
MFGPFGPFGMRFDWPEFLLGFIIAIVLFLIIFRFRPLLRGIQSEFQGKISDVTGTIATRSADRYLDELVSRAESRHLARALFPLSEVIVEPRLLASPTSSDQSRGEAVAEDVYSILPNLPDTAGLEGIFVTPTISFSDALTHGANLLLTGGLGSGKSCALSYLTLSLIKRNSDFESLRERIPILVHAADFRLERFVERNPLEALVDAAQRTVSTGVAATMQGYITKHFEEGRAFLLLDGLDEFPEEEIFPFAAWLEELFSMYPQTRAVVAAPTMFYDGLVQAGLAPVVIAPWSDIVQRQLLQKWGAGWQKRVVPNLPKDRIDDIDPALINGWLTGSFRGLSPMEITLKTWSAYAGDSRGVRVVDDLEAYLTRLLSPDEREKAQFIGLSWISNIEGSLDERALGRGLPLSDLAQAGILEKRADSRISFTQPAIGAYLSSLEMIKTSIPDTNIEARWLPGLKAFHYFAIQADAEPIVDAYLDNGEDPIQLDLLTVGSWLMDSPPKIAWRARVLRNLAQSLQNAKLPYGLRLRALNSLVLSREPTSEILFKRLLNADAGTSRALAALGLGGLGYETVVEDLLRLLHQDRDLLVRQAACLGLAAIGTDQAMEGLGHSLLEGDEAVRLAAAEALANQPDEGHAMLREAAVHNDLLTRRSAVFGLARINEPWAGKALEEIQLEDKQWVVRGAAAESLERWKNSTSKIEPPIQDLTQSTWLVEFATREGLGVAPGRASLEMARRALQKGTPDEKVAALDALSIVGGEELVLDLYNLMSSKESYLRDGAYEALWRLSASGVSLPSVESLNLA